MAIARYDPYTDRFIYEDSKTSTSATISIESMPKNIIQMKVVELSSECIDKIADAVVKKLAEQTEPNNSEKPNNCEVSEIPTGSIISKMEQVETEPQTFDKPTKCLGCLYSDLDKDFHPCASCENFSKYVGEVSGKDEPQTERSE